MDKGLTDEQLRLALKREKPRFSLLESIFAVNGAPKILYTLWAKDPTPTMSYTALLKFLDIPPMTFARAMWALRDVGLIRGKPVSLKEIEGMGIKLRKKKRKYYFFYLTKRGQKVADQLFSWKL